MKYRFLNKYEKKLKYIYILTIEFNFWKNSQCILIQIFFYFTVVTEVENFLQQIGSVNLL